MKNFLVVLLVAFVLAACAPAGPYVPPDQCAEGNPSLILEKFPDPRVLDKGLMTAQLMAFKLVKGYDYAKAVELIDKLESYVDKYADMTYAQLLIELTTSIENLNRDAGAVILISGADISVLESPERITACDRVLIRQEFERQRLLISLYAPSTF